MIDRRKLCGSLKCFSIISCMVFFAVGSVFFTGSSASASSQYDTYLKKANKLTIKSDDYWTPCTNDYKKDWSTSWTSLISDPQYWTYGGESSKQSEYWTAFQDSLDGGDWIALSQSDTHNNPVRGTSIRIIYSPKGMIADWTTSSNGVFVKAKDNSNLYEITFQVFQGGGCQPKSWQATRVASSQIGILNNGGSGTWDSLIALFVVSNTDMNYPPGYEGVTAPTEWTPPLKLRYNWSIDDNGKLTAIYLQNIKNNAMLDSCGIKWTLNNSNNSWNIGTQLNTTTSQQFMPYKYESLTPGFYILNAKIAECVPFIDDGSIDNSTVLIAYNGSFVAGTSDSGGNSKTPLAEQSALINSFGLTQAIQAPINAINSLQSATCSPVTIPLWTGSSIVLPCLSSLYSSSLPVFFNIWQISLTGIVGYWFAIKMMAHIKSLLNPNDDSIQVVNL